MSNKVTIIFNTLDESTWVTEDVDHVGNFIASQFKDGFPDTARVYCGQVSSMTDVTPTNEAEIERLEKLTEPVFVVVFPGEPLTILYGLVAVLIVAVVVLAKQTPPNVTIRNSQAQSSNNELSERTNKPRPNGRIPDIFGTVRSTPDLLSAPYLVFDSSNREVEYCYMCIGRGYYDIPVNSVRDDTTLVSSISGTSIEIYKPFTSPNSADQPQLRIGTAIQTKLKNTQRVNSVNGQVIRAPNEQVVRGNNNIKFVAPNRIEANPSSDIDFTTSFDPVSTITIENAIKYSGYINYVRDIYAEIDGFYYEIPGPINTDKIFAGTPLRLAARFSIDTGTGPEPDPYWDVGGLYEVDSVVIETLGTIYLCHVKLVSPQAINSNWLNLPYDQELETGANIQVPDGEVLLNLNGEYFTYTVSEKLITLADPQLVAPDWATITDTGYMSPVLFVNSVDWVGPFTVPGGELNGVYCNFVAQNGLYKANNDGQKALLIGFEVELTPVNANGIQSGDVITRTGYLQGSDINQEFRGLTLKIEPVPLSRYTVRARRITLRDYEFEGQIVDEIKWRDAYGVKEVLNNDFGNVTTVQTITIATTGALAVKERKLNMLVSRCIPKRLSGNVFSTELFPTTNPAEIFCAVSLDNRIGNRTLAELDVDSIYGAVAEAYAYFGNPNAVGFSYTLDSTNLSYEETATMIANVAFSTAYRRGNILKLSFEKPVENSTLLFNHSNKIPNSETRSTRFGNQENYDGVAYSYVDPTDDAIVTLYIPEDRTSINPRDIESVGVRSKLQAYFIANREWNRIRYGNTMVEFTATQEASMLVTNDRILLADGTRPGDIDGEIVEQFGATVTLSRPVALPPEPFLFVQHDDGTTESIAVAGQLDQQTLALANAPRRPLATGSDLYARSTFILVGNQNTRQNAFLVTEKNPKENMTVSVTAVNYDDRYYQNDDDFKNGIVDQNGNYI